MTPIWWLLFFIPGLVALYFLKLKRQDVVISSTLLWKRSLEDLHVNAPFQRLRRNWLLLLQLLVVATLIAAAWRPRISGSVGVGRNLLLLLDNSASMSAREKDGTRLELARRDALALVSTMTASDRMGLLVFSSGLQVLEPLTANRGLLEARLKSVAPTSLPSNLGAALIVASGMAQSLSDAEVHVFGDGCYGDLSGLPPEVKRTTVQLVSAGTNLENSAVTEIGVRRSFDARGRTEVFALIEHFAATAIRLTATLRVDGVTRDAREVDVAGGGSQAVIFDVSTIEDGIAEISINSADALEMDDRAWVRIVPRSPIRVLLVGKSNPWLDLVMQSSSGVTHRRWEDAEYARATSGVSRDEARRRLEADVVIFDRADPAAFGAAGAGEETVRQGLPEPVLPSLYLACRPSLRGGARVVDGQEKPVVIDWDRAHPLTRFIVLTDLFIETSSVFQVAGDMRSVVDGESGSLIAVSNFYPPGERSIPAVLVGFDILKTNWPIGHYSFPIFFTNALEWLASGGASISVTHVRSGEALVYVPQSSSGAGMARFKSPGGLELDGIRESSGDLTLAAPTETGIYEVIENGEIRARIPVGLLNARESKLEPSPVIDFGEFKVKVETSRTDGARDLWKWFAAAALLLCLFEWLVYNRRLAG